MEQDVKDILVDGDTLPDVNDAITKATTALKEQLAKKDEETRQLREQYQRVAKVADERGQEVDRALTQLHGASAYTVRAEQAAISNALAAAEAESKTLQADLAAAIETANGQRAADLHVKIAELTARKHTLELGKERIDEEVAKAKEAPAPQPRRSVAQEADPYEAMIAPLPENQKQWLRKHKDKAYVAPGKPPSDKLLQAYYGAKAAGLAEDGPAFTVYLDRILGHVPNPQQQAKAPAAQEGDASERFQEAPKQQAPQQQAARKPAVPAAPPSRGQGGAANSAGPRVQLSREQKHTAQRLGMTDAEYVKGIQEGIRRGKIPASALQQLG